MAISVKTDHKLSQNFMSSETKKVNQSKSKKSTSFAIIIIARIFSLLQVEEKKHKQLKSIVIS